jgi:class 3 adenylate cyclase
MNRRVYRLNGVERRHARENPGYQFRQEQRFAPPRGEMPRRLAAIVAGDIAGYSRLMELDEEGTHLRVKRIQRDLVEPSIAEHHGRLVKTTGDGFFAIFDSPVEAVRDADPIFNPLVLRERRVAPEHVLLDYDTAAMGGCVDQWVEDCWHKNYHGAPSDGSA